MARTVLGTPSLMAANSQGFLTAVLARAVRINDAPRGIKELPFSCYPNINEDTPACCWDFKQPTNSDIWAADLYFATRGVMA